MSTRASSTSDPGLIHRGVVGDLDGLALAFLHAFVDGAEGAGRQRGPLRRLVGSALVALHHAHVGQDFVGFVEGFDDVGDLPVLGALHKVGIGQG